jgi:hypothetical protein
MGVIVGVGVVDDVGRREGVDGDHATRLVESAARGRGGLGAGAEGGSAAVGLIELHVVQGQVQGAAAGVQGAAEAAAAGPLEGGRLFDHGR